MMAQKTCKITGQTFPIHAEDQAFYEKMGVPTPTLCPSERMRRRMAWRNESTLYRRKCSGNGQDMLAIYHPDYPGPIYSQEYFWSDEWDPSSYAQNFDFSKPFFEQFEAMKQVVPRISLLSKNSTNAHYTNHASNNKNCYLSFIVFGCEEVHYSRKVFNCRDIMDSQYIFKDSELLYECFWMSKAYNCSFLINSHGVNDCHFSVDLRNCANCAFCSNLRGKKYHFQNQAYTPEQYQEKLAQYLNGSHQALEKAKELWMSVREKAIYKDLEMMQSENCTGDYLFNCQDCHQSYYCSISEGLRYCFECDPSSKQIGGRDCMDVYGFGSCELIYETQAQANGYANIGTNFSYDVSNCSYVDNCHNITDSLGCIGMKKGQNLIFNKSYTQYEYEKLSKKIIQHMRETAEWGEFFPISMSPFAYNETVAQECFPLTKAEALKQGLKWRDEMPEGRNQESDNRYQIPDNMADIDQGILDQVLHCEESGKAFKIQSAELKFYQKMPLPIPRLHPNIRHQKRSAIRDLRNPRYFRKALCPECQETIETTYRPDHGEKILCEACYLQAVN